MKSKQILERRVILKVFETEGNIKSVSKIWVIRVRNAFISIRMEPIVGFCKHGNEPLC